MKRHGRIAFHLAVCTVLAAPWALADGLIRDGIGAISTGRGGTNIAHSDNGAVLLDNPAGMANLTRTGLFEIGVDAVFTDLDYSDPQNAEINNDFWPCAAPHVTYMRKSCDGIWAYGIGVYAPAGFSAKYDMNHPVTGPSLYKSIGILGKVLPGVAVNLTDRLSVGATLGLGFSHVELEGPFHLQTTVPGLPTQFDLQTNGTTITGSVGLQYQVSDQTTIGVTYTEESQFELEGDVRTTLYGLPRLPPISAAFEAQMDITWPRSLGVGMKHDLNCRHRVSCDVIWYNWSEAFDSLTITLHNPNHPLVGMVGPTITEVLPMNWDDTVSVRLGYEWMANCRDVWRLGYVFHDDPVPNGTLNPYTDGVLEHAFAVGMSRRYDRCLLNLAYQYSFSPERQVGTSEIAGGDFSNSTFQAQAHWACASVLVPF